MPTYLTPGVYYEPVDTSRGRLTAVRTDITAFIGLAERGPLHTARRVDSWQQFQTLYGDCIPGGYLAYSAKAYFENGGRRAYIVRVAADDAQTAVGNLLGRDGNPTLTIAASSAGGWGNRLQVRLANGRSRATTTHLTQPADGSASDVASIVGFPVGSLVRLFQKPGGTAEIEEYRVVTAVAPADRRLIWNAPIKLVPAFVGDPVFDLSAPIDLETITYTLTVYEAGAIRALYEDLGLLPAHPRYAPDLIQLPEPVDGEQAPPPLIQVTDAHAGDPPPSSWADWLPDVDAATPQFSAGLLTLIGGTDGLTHLQTADFTGDLSATERRGLRALEKIEDVSLVACPDILIQPAPPLQFDPLPPPEVDPCLPPCPPLPPPTAPPPPPVVMEQPPQFSEFEIALVQQAIVTHCELLADRVAILDPLPPQGTAVLDPSQVLGWRQRFDSSYAALYYPWMLVVDPLRLGGQIVRAIPPSGHVAGVIARTDLRDGVHKAPANEITNWAQGLTLDVTAEWQGILNPAHVNCLRLLPGRGLRVFGARTLSSDTAWRFLNVRRLLILIEKSISLSIQWAVFEPNDFYLRQTLILAISSFLQALWQRGALVGSTAEEAFFVLCDETNNPPEVSDAGQLIIDVGVAPTSPAEFVVLRIGRTRDELEITEQAGLYS
ncbi:MAG: phage tail sheath family protein [Ardenticatenaceae bacterium]|nr:phage tail sheath family protein [Ardenticatenaceae bacterium]